MITKQDQQSATLNSATMACPLPLTDYPEIVQAHGGGGQLSQELVEHLFLPAFRNPELQQLADSTVLTLADQNLAFSTDSFVVRPLFFPGGSIGELAVHGTVNDVAMSGATPLYLSVGMIIEEGLPLDTLSEIVHRMANAAQEANVQIVAGDTKVVEHGHGDGLYINTTGIGVVPDGIELAPSQIRVGDAVLISGTIGDHGMAIMSVREGLEFSSPIESDTAALHSLVAKMLEVCPTVRMLRDPTRGGLATSLNEIAAAANLGIVLREDALPIDSAVRSACELLGIDPLYVANEGKLVAIVPKEHAEMVLCTMQQHPAGRNAAIVGQVVEQYPQKVVMENSLGSMRIVHLPMGEQLPRIC